MGVDYSPVLYIGKEFEDQHEAEDFYQRFFEISEEYKEFIDTDGFEGFCYGLGNGLSGEMLNCYSGYGFVLGINIGSSIRNSERFAENVSDAITKWKGLFKDEPFDVIHTVRVW